jgi:steroid 5-alpha reductase family enzyme
MLPILLYSLIIIVLINIAIYFWAYAKQSDHLTDISYSACFVGLTLFLYWKYSAQDIGATLLLGMVTLWGLRLGGFLFYRIKAIGKDKRFDDFRGSWVGFLKFFLLQGISIWVIAIPIILYLGAEESSKYSILGIVIWFFGWIIETLADQQKFSFKQKNPDSFYQGGLFSKIRHPNYLGEILVWIGIFVFTLPIYSGWTWLALVSPVWIVILLVGISGIPLLENKAWKKYGDDPEFQKYLKNSWRLFPYIY